MCVWKQFFLELVSSIGIGEDAVLRVRVASDEEQVGNLV